MNWRSSLGQSAGVWTEPTGAGTVRTAFATLIGSLTHLGERSGFPARRGGDGQLMVDGAGGIFTEALVEDLMHPLQVEALRASFVVRVEMGADAPVSACVHRPGPRHAAGVWILARRLGWIEYRRSAQSGCSADADKG